MKKFFLSVLFVIVVIAAQAQAVNIRISIPDYTESELTFCSQFGDNSRIIDTLITDNQGLVVYKPTNLTYGVYRLYLQDEEYFEIIVNEPEISLSLLAATPMESMQVITSEENKIFYGFLQKNSRLKKQNDALVSFLANYPQGKLYKQVQKEYNKVLKQQEGLTESIYSSYPKSFAARMIRYYKAPVFPPDVIAGGNEALYLRDNFFKLYPCDDTLLINSPVYSNITINYLKLFSVNGDYKASVAGFTKAAENLLTHVAGNEKLQAHFLNILINGFESLQLFDVADMLLAKFGSQCLNSDNMNTRYKNVTEMKEGVEAPILFVKNSKSELVPYAFEKKTLVVFWATWCDHCRQTIPELNDYLKNHPSDELNVVLISLDTDPGELKRFIAENSISIPVQCDFRSWSGTNVVNYMVYATPFFYLIDENGRIIAKPHDYNELIELIK
ncbi:MAG TPA: thioredoxin-like domain-containing protein [Bacteroidales bacterium]|nr:thioredoxin-like domain-containing protein [Bacteroidales bacterium]HQL70392.1 thioredoxin-like domain-containing protein [Bacteroidales bacterium]